MFRLGYIIVDSYAQMNCENCFIYTTERLDTSIACRSVVVTVTCPLSCVFSKDRKGVTI